MVSFEVSGVVAPVFTPVAEDGQLNLNVIPGYAQYLADNNIRGILVGGTTGEAVTLSLDERKALLCAWIDHAKQLGIKIIAQIGGVPLPEVLEMAKLAEEYEADAIMTLPELYFKPRSTEALVSYLEMVSNVAPSLPIIYYHFPMMSGVEVNIPQFFSLASSRIPNFKGMKADLEAAVQVADELAHDQRIFIGNHLLAPAALLGHHSSIATVTNLFPKLVTEIVEHMKNDQLAEARSSQLHLNRLLGAIASQGDFVPSMKAAMELVTGIRVGPPRQPLSAVDGDCRGRIAVNLQQLGIDIQYSYKN